MLSPRHDTTTAEIYGKANKTPRNQQTVQEKVTVSKSQKKRLVPRCKSKLCKTPPQQEPPPLCHMLECHNWLRKPTRRYQFRCLGRVSVYCKQVLTLTIYFYSKAIKQTTKGEKLESVALILTVHTQNTHIKPIVRAMQSTSLCPLAEPNKLKKQLTIFG